MNAEEEAAAWRARHLAIAGTNHRVENQRKCLSYGCGLFDGKACTQSKSPDKCNPRTRPEVDQLTNRRVRKLLG